MSNGESGTAALVSTQPGEPVTQGTNGVLYDAKGMPVAPPPPPAQSAPAQSPPIEGGKLSTDPKLAGVILPPGIGQPAPAASLPNAPAAAIDAAVAGIAGSDPNAFDPSKAPTSAPGHNSLEARGFITPVNTNTGPQVDPSTAGQAAPFPAIIRTDNSALPADQRNAMTHEDAMIAHTKRQHAEEEKGTEQAIKDGVAATSWLENSQRELRKRDEARQASYREQVAKTEKVAEWGKINNVFAGYFDNQRRLTAGILAAGLYRAGKGDHAIKVLEKAMETEYEGQKLAIQKANANNQVAQNSLATYRSMFDNEKQADLAWEAEGFRLITAKAKTNALMSKSAAEKEANAALVSKLEMTTSLRRDAQNRHNIEMTNNPNLAKGAVTKYMMGPGQAQSQQPGQQPAGQPAAPPTRQMSAGQAAADQATPIVGAQLGQAMVSPGQAGGAAASAGRGNVKPIDAYGGAPSTGLDAISGGSTAPSNESSFRSGASEAGRFAADNVEPIQPASNAPVVVNGNAKYPSLAAAQRRVSGGPAQSPPPPPGGVQGKAAAIAASRSGEGGMEVTRPHGPGDAGYRSVQEIFGVDKHGQQNPKGNWDGGSGVYYPKGYAPLQFGIDHGGNERGKKVYLVPQGSQERVAKKVDAHNQAIASAHQVQASLAHLQQVQKKYNATDFTKAFSDTNEFKDKYQDLRDAYARVKADTQQFTVSWWHSNIENNAMQTGEYSKAGDIYPDLSTWQGYLKHSQSGGIKLLDSAMKRSIENSNKNIMNKLRSEGVSDSDLVSGKPGAPKRYTNGKLTGEVEWNNDPQGSNKIYMLKPYTGGKD